MTKKEILSSSRPFLYGIYKMYVNRACENLGVSPDSENNTDSNTQLTERDYPVEFKKITKADREKAASKFKDDNDFLNGFSDFSSSKFLNF